MPDQAANNALAAISGHLHPGAWQKTERAEENLRSFNEWYESYKRWTNVCLRGIDMDESMKWDMLIAAGGKDLHNFIKEANIVTNPTPMVREEGLRYRNSHTYPEYRKCKQPLSRRASK